MDLRKFAESAPSLGVLGIKVSQNGELTGKQLWDEECRRNVYSASKSVTALAVGFAVQEGLLSLDEKLTDVFPNELPSTVGAHLAAATVRDLLTMRLGQARPNLMGAQRPLYVEDNWVRMSLALPFSDAPDTHFLYNNVGPYLAGVLVQRRSGCDLVSYLTPRLFSHLGIKRPTWECDPLGYIFGAGGLFLTLSELHKLGLFCLSEGEWNGRKLLDSAWIRECARQQGEDPYGYLFWRGKYNSYRMDGKYSQLSVVVPEKRAVVTVVSECRKNAELMALLYDEVCAQL